jgi:YD repeat-containing protein
VLTQTVPDTSAIDYIYDNTGNVIQTVSAWGVVDYEYDYENRLVGITYPLPWGAVTNYFSPEGQRLARVERDGTLTYYFPTLLGTVVEMDAGGNTLTRLNPDLGFVTGGIANYVHWDGSDSTTLFTDAGAVQVAAFGFGYFGEMLYGTGNVAGVDAGLYAAGMKVDWDPALGAELIDVDYAPDIAQRFGGPIFVAGLDGQDQINDDDEEIDRPLWPDVPPPEDWPPIQEKKECKGPCRAQGWWLAWTQGRANRGLKSAAWKRASAEAKKAADAICRERACDEKCICSGNKLPGTSYSETWYDSDAKLRYYYAYVDFAGKCIKLP